jgi:hypothetical protein
MAVSALLEALQGFTPDRVPNLLAAFCGAGGALAAARQAVSTRHGRLSAAGPFSFKRPVMPLPIGRLSVGHYQAIHRHLFQDVYPWTGMFRNVRIIRDGSMFCYATDCSPFLATSVSSLSEAPRGCFSPRSHWLTSPVVTLR